jgi:hypothetical protein
MFRMKIMPERDITKCAMKNNRKGTFTPSAEPKRLNGCMNDNN